MPKCLEVLFSHLVQPSRDRLRGLTKPGLSAPAFPQFARAGRISGDVPMQDPLDLVNKEYCGSSRRIHNYDNTTVEDGYQIFLDIVEDLVHARSKDAQLWELWELHSLLYAFDGLCKYLLDELPAYSSFRALVNDKRFGTFLGYVQNGSQAYGYGFDSNSVSKPWQNRVFENSDMIEYFNLWIITAVSISNELLGCDISDGELEKRKIKKLGLSDSAKVTQKIASEKQAPGKPYRNFHHLYREVFGIAQVDKKNEPRFRSWKRKIEQDFGKGIEKRKGNAIFVHNSIKGKLKIPIGAPAQKQP
jgi:hypothetical protein